MTDQTYESLRKRALTRRSADLGITRRPGRPVWGVVMETSDDQGVTTLVATDDGAVTLLLSAGGGVYLAKDQWPHSAGTRLITSAAEYMFECAPAWSYPLPENGMVRFYLLTYDGVLTAETPPKDLKSGKSPFAYLFYAAHDVLLLTRLVSQDPNWRSYKPGAGQAAGAAGTQPQVLPEMPAAAPVTAAPQPVIVVPQAATPPAAAARADGPPAETPAGGAPPAGVQPAEAQPAAAPRSDLLLRAAARNDVDEVARLLAEGHDHEPNAKGVTPLMGAAHAGALEPLRLLLAAGAPVDTKDSHGYTALVLACNAGHAVCVRLLLGAGADVEARDHEGLTPIMFAAQNGHDDIVRILMERGADPNAVSSRGMTAVSLAKKNSHEQTASLLLGGYELPTLGQ